MSPVEPRPVVMGTMGSPSTMALATLGFLPKMPAAVNFAGASTVPLTAPSAARNERRFHPNFKFTRSVLSRPLAKLFISNRRSDDHCAAYDFNQRIARNPFQSHASAGRSFPRREIGPVDLVQCVILRFMGIEPRLASGHRNTVGERQTEKDLEMDDAVHGAARALDRFLERVHGAGHV